MSAEEARAAVREAALALERGLGDAGALFAALATLALAEGHLPVRAVGAVWTQARWVPGD